MGSSLTQGYNYTRLGEYTCTGASAYLEVQNIPSGYRFLIVYLNIASTAGAGALMLNLNNDAGANKYTRQFIKSAAAAVSSGAATSTQATILDAIPAGYSGAIQMQLNQYPTIGFKAFSTLGALQDRTYNVGGTYDSSAEISRIKVEVASGALDTGSSMLVYGVR